MPIVPKRPHFFSNRPHFVLDCMPKVSDCPHFVPDCMPKVPYRPYFVPNRMLSKRKVPDRPHFVLDRILFRGCFGLHFTFFMTWRVFAKKLKFWVKSKIKSLVGG
ncbi:hypothetical protein AMTRI_Chr02g258380 [Amborella trichopoda]